MTNAIGVTFDGSIPLPGQTLQPTGHDPLVITTHEDLDKFIAALIEDYGTHAAYARVLDPQVGNADEYPAQSLSFAVNQDGKVGGLKYYEEATIWYALGSPATDEVEYVFFGNSTPWPTDSRIPLNQVKAAVNHFREHSGARWGGVEWKAWPEEIPV